MSPSNVFTRIVLLAAAATAATAASVPKASDPTYIVGFFPPGTDGAHPADPTYKAVTTPKEACKSTNPTYWNNTYSNWANICNLAFTSNTGTNSPATTIEQECTPFSNGTFAAKCTGYHDDGMFVNGVINEASTTLYLVSLFNYVPASEY